MKAANGFGFAVSLLAGLAGAPLVIGDENGDDDIDRPPKIEDFCAGTVGVDVFSVLLLSAAALFGVTGFLSCSAAKMAELAGVLLVAAAVLDDLIC